MGVTDDMADGIDEIAEVLSSVAADIAKVEEVLGHLSNYRSIVIEFDNHTSLSLNDAYIVLSGPDTITSKFRVRCLIGAGNQGAHLRYQLNRHADYSLRKWLADHNVLLQDPNQPPSFTNDGVKIALPRSGRNLPAPGQAFSLRIFFTNDGDQTASSSS